MKTDAALVTAAQNIALELQGGARNLQTELEEIETKKRQVEMKLEMTRSAIKRALNFQARSGTQFYCPNCWVRSNQKVILDQIPGTRHADIHRCDTCGWDITIAFGL